MYRCVAYTEALRDEWDRFVLARGTIFHTIAFRQILVQSFGYECGYHAIVDEDNHICAVIPLITGRNLQLKRVGVSLPFVNYMDICANSEAALSFAVAAITKIKSDHDLAYIELRLKEQNIAESCWNINLNHHTFVLPLSEDEEKVLSLSTASNRNHVRKVYKNNWFTVSFDAGYLEDFYRVYIRRMKQLGSPAPDIQFFKYFFAYLPDNTALLTVLDQETGVVVGGMFLVTSPGNATLYYPYGANCIEYNSKYLNNFMYWEAVRFGIRSGLQYLDLGRSQAGSGTYKYKQQWGANAEQLKYVIYADGRASSGPPNRENLNMFIELWKDIPGFITNGVGRYLIKYLMP
jgi:FemAB-related protein (PEP-CTERM system-associated)